MTSVSQFIKLYAPSLIVCFGLDLLWLGIFAKKFYERQLGHLLRPDVQWVPAALFYMIYVAALIVFVVQPALDRGSLVRASALGALFGIAAYSAFDLTCLALLRNFPAAVAIVDLAWGATLSAAVCAAAFSISRSLLS